MGEESMNRIAKIVALLVALTAAFSFSQENLSVPMEKTIVYDTVTVRRVISDSVTIEALEKSQTFFSNSLYWLLCILTIAIAVIGFLNVNSGKNLGEKIKNQLNSLKKELEKELEKEITEKLNKEIEETLKEEREKNQNNFNAAYKKIAEIYYILAKDESSAVNECKNKECKDKHWLRHFMYLSSFYYALNKMSIFKDDNELIFIRLVRKFTYEYNKNMLMPDVKFFYHFLLFIEHSEKLNTAIFEETKMTYNQLLKIFDYNKIVEYIANSEFDKERVQKLLKLAECYKDKAYLEILDSGKL
jgi:hypothetical protein